MDKLTAKCLKTIIESRTRNNVEIYKDWTNYIKVYPRNSDLPNNRWFLNNLVELIPQYLRDVCFYIEHNDSHPFCLVVYGKRK